MAQDETAVIQTQERQSWRTQMYLVALTLSLAFTALWGWMVAIGLWRLVAW